MTSSKLQVKRIAILILVFWAAPAAAQFPSKFTNLQVLPKDISRAQLQSTMRALHPASFRARETPTIIPAVPTPPQNAARRVPACSTSSVPMPM